MLFFNITGSDMRHHLSSLLACAFYSCQVIILGLQSVLVSVRGWYSRVSTNEIGFEGIVQKVPVRLQKAGSTICGGTRPLSAVPALRSTVACLLGMSGPTDILPFPASSEAGSTGPRVFPVGQKEISEPKPNIHMQISVKQSLSLSSFHVNCIPQSAPNEVRLCRCDKTSLNWFLCQWHLQDEFLLAWESLAAWYLT